MEKLVYLLWRDPTLSENAFAERLECSVGPKLAAAGARSVAVSWAHAHADLGGSVPIRETGSEFHGLVSFWLPCVDDAPAYEAILRDAAGRIAGYLVTESVPRDFDARTWPNGTRSPGKKLITVFEQPARLTRDEFIARWHGSHTPLSLEIHPMWRYVRNVVARPLTPGAPSYAGIVEEHFRELADITDPERFYGGKEKLARNLKRVIDDVRTFLDLERVTSVVASETILS
ncbi:MAG TPA: EthD domain-containing protein [Myxococcota bacterium]|nr:EthD domain-containing protein [Myxococcota bacterium]